MAQLQPLSSLVIIYRRTSLRYTGHTVTGADRDAVLNLADRLTAEGGQRVRIIYDDCEELLVTLRDDGLDRLLAEARHAHDRLMAGAAA